VATGAGTNAQVALDEIVPRSMGISTGRVTEPNDVAELTVFLASPRSANITAAEFVIDGGQIKSHLNRESGDQVRAALLDVANKQWPCSRAGGSGCLRALRFRREHRGLRAIEGGDGLLSLRHDDSRNQNGVKRLSHPSIRRV
jgi:Enoyl-(Acyl carrier protein) reductase